MNLKAVFKLKSKTVGNETLSNTGKVLKTKIMNYTFNNFVITFEVYFFIVGA